MPHNETFPPQTRLEAAAELLAVGIFRLILRNRKNLILSVEPSSNRLDFRGPKSEQAESPDAG